MVFIVLIGFAFGIGAAIGAYAGGTQFEHYSVGYAFWGNFWCDLLRNPAINGVPSPEAARYSTMALWLLGSGLLPFWGVAAELAAPRASGPSAARAAIQALGMAGMLGLMGITLLPSHLYPIPHGILVSVAGPLGLLGTALAVTRGWSSPRMPELASWLGALALVASLANLVQYTRQVWFFAEQSPLLPGVQKVATLLFLGWVLSVTSVGFAGRRQRS